jgi:serine/threonine protein kinase
MQDAATIISQAARGLAHAHSRGLVHRDVKPGNLLVTPEGLTKVSDLGLASFLGVDDPEDPRAGRIVGTADYLSPEHIVSPGNLLPASDIYSLGCTLYYAITGKVPFPGGTSRDKARRHVEDPPITPRRFQTELSDAFIDVIADMMHKDPRKRIASAEEVVRRLAPWAGDSVAGALRSVAATGGLRPGLPAASDGELNLFESMPAGSEDGHSQISQRTDAIASASHETRPDLDPDPVERHDDPRLPLPLVVVVLGSLLLAAGSLLAGLIIKALH